MTKYVLQSGGLKRERQLRKAFHSELVEGFDTGIRILICVFAEPRGSWEDKYSETIEWIREDIGIRVEFELATLDVFEQQVEQADVVYIRGGDISILLHRLDSFDLKRIFSNKVVAAVSAGSMAMAQEYYACDWRVCRDDGSGLLPIKFGAHFYSDFGSDALRGPIDWDYAHKTLKEYGDTSLPIFALKEGEYAIFEDTKHIKTVTQEDIA